jgi:hypothetical protein
MQIKLIYLKKLKTKIYISKYTKIVKSILYKTKPTY